MDRTVSWENYLIQILWTRWNKAHPNGWAYVLFIWENPAYKSNQNTFKKIFCVPLDVLWKQPINSADTTLFLKEICVPEDTERQTTHILSVYYSKQISVEWECT